MVFVGGVGRSGTSLLMSMLHSHPKISFLPETHFVRRYLGYNMLGSTRLLRRMRSDGVLRRLSEASPYWEMLLGGVDDRWASGLRLYIKLIEGARDQGVDIVGDKSPRYVELIPLLSWLFPCSAFIEVRRDPRDVIVSRRRAEWSKGRSLIRELGICRLQRDLGQRWGDDYYGSHYIPVQYEGLLCNPQKYLRHVCLKLGIEFNCNMMEYQESAGELMYGGERSWKQNTTRPLMRDNFGKWQENLSDRELVIVEAATGEYFYLAPTDRAGRSVPDRVISVLTRAYASILSAVGCAVVLVDNWLRMASIVVKRQWYEKIQVK